MLVKYVAALSFVPCVLVVADVIRYGGCWRMGWLTEVLWADCCERRLLQAVITQATIKRQAIED